MGSEDVEIPCLQAGISEDIANSTERTAAMDNAARGHQEQVPTTLTNPPLPDCHSKMALNLKDGVYENNSGDLCTEAGEGGRGSTHEPQVQLNGEISAGGCESLHASERNISMVAMLCIPARFVPTDLITILGPFRSHILAVRLVRHCDDPRQFVALIALDSAQQARVLVRELDGRPFNSFEEALPCMLAFVHTVRFDEKPSSEQHRSSSPTSPISSPVTTVVAAGDRHPAMQAATQNLSTVSSEHRGHDRSQAISGAAEDPSTKALRAMALTVDHGILPLGTLSAVRCSSSSIAHISSRSAFPEDGIPDGNMQTRKEMKAVVRASNKLDRGDGDGLRSSPVGAEGLHAPTNLAALVFPTLLSHASKLSYSSTGKRTNGGSQSPCRSDDQKSGQNVGSENEQNSQVDEEELGGDYCVVCLERMDSPASAACLTTACNHSFHLACLLRWEDSPCPVCRYHHNLAIISSQCDGTEPLSNPILSMRTRSNESFDNAIPRREEQESLLSGSTTISNSSDRERLEREGNDDKEHNSESSSSASQLDSMPLSMMRTRTQRCGETSGLLVCVICGHVGCGQYGRRGHAKLHYEESLHAYALEMDTQQVWDFAGDGYVHRLIVSKGEEPRAVSPRSLSEMRNIDDDGEMSSHRYNQFDSADMSRGNDDRNNDDERRASILPDSTNGGSSRLNNGWNAGVGSQGILQTPSPKLVEVANPRGAVFSTYSSLVSRNYYSLSSMSPSQMNGTNAFPSNAQISDNSNMTLLSAPEGASAAIAGNLSSEPYRGEGATETRSIYLDYSRVSKPRSLSDRESEHHVHRKLEGLAYQYSELLTGQLESQRTHYEQQLAMLRHESEARAAEHASFGMLMSKVRAVGITTSNSSLLDSGDRSGKSGRGLRGRKGIESPLAPSGEDTPWEPTVGDLLAALAREKRQLQQRVDAAHRRLKRVRDEAGVVEAFSSQLQSNISAWDSRIEAEESKVAEIAKIRKALVPTLEARVSEYMANLDGTAGIGGCSIEDHGVDRTEVCFASSMPAAAEPHLSLLQEKQDEGDSSDTWLVGMNTPSAAAIYNSGGSGLSSGKKKKKKRK